MGKLISQQVIGVLSLAFFVFWFSWMSSYCPAQDQLLQRSYSSWREYEDIRVRGKAERYLSGSVVEEIPFELNIASTGNGRPGKLEIGHRIRNPGEPHISDEWIFKRAWARTDLFTVKFERNLITESLSNNRSVVFLMSRPVFDEPFSEILRALVVTFFNENPRFGFGQQSLDKNRLTVVGDEKYLGIDVKRVVVLDEGAEIESLVALEPTFQVLKFVATRGLNADLDSIYRNREVESVRVIGNRLFCDRVWTVALNGGRWCVQIEEVQELQSNYVGLWDIDRMTGADFVGDLEQATRTNSPRKRSELFKEVSYIGYTQSEQESIRRYLMSHVAPMKPRRGWTTILFWIANIVALSVLVLFAVRRMRSN